MQFLLIQTASKMRMTVFKFLSVLRIFAILIICGLVFSQLKFLLSIKLRRTHVHSSLLKSYVLL